LLNFDDYCARLVIVTPWHTYLLFCNVAVFSALGKWGRFWPTFSINVIVNIKGSGKETL